MKTLMAWLGMGFTLVGVSMLAALFVYVCSSLGPTGLIFGIGAVCLVIGFCILGMLDN